MIFDFLMNNYSIVGAPADLYVKRVYNENKKN